MEREYDFEVLRKDPNITGMWTMKKDCILPSDLYCIIAGVEEVNAEFEAFYFRDWPGRPEKLCGYPVHYSDKVKMGEFWGGMWSDWKEGESHPEHSAAFVRMTWYHNNEQ